MLKVSFSGSLLEMKEWLAEMPDNLAAVFHTSFEAVTRPPLSQVEQEARAAALPHLAKGMKIAAIKAVRTIAQLNGSEYLGTLKGAKEFVEAFVEAYELEREKTAGQPSGGR